MIARSMHFSLFAVAALSACGSHSSATVANGADATTPTRPKLKAAMDQTTSMMAATPSAKQFADLAAKNDAFEIAAARLAQAKSASAAVKAYAAKMIAAHTASTAKIGKAAAAARPAIVPDASSTPDYDAKLAELRKLTGAAFDRAYAAGQVHEHHAALSLFQLYARGGDVPSLKTAAVEIMAVIRQHIGMAEALEK